MEEQTLEKEIPAYIEEHKRRTIKDYLKRYYDDLYNTGVQIPEFMLSKKPKELVEKVYNSIINNKEFIDKKYEQAYQRNALIEGWGESLGGNN